MKLKFTHKINPVKGVVIIPLSKSKGLTRSLTKIASKFSIKRKVLLKGFSANAGESITLLPDSKKRSCKTLLIGLGSNVSHSKKKRHFSKAVISVIKERPVRITIDFQHSNVSSKNSAYLDLVSTLVEGAFLGTYKIGLLQSNSNRKTRLPKELVLNVRRSITKKLRRNARKGLLTAKTKLKVLDLVNAPANQLTPQQFGKIAINSARKYDYSARVLNKAEIKKAGLATLLAVNRGSELPPRFIILEYGPKHKKKVPVVCLVGKGVTFDSGGLSLKGAKNMHYMKSDMGGAAAVFGAIELTAKLKLDVRLIGIIPTTDKAVDAKSIRPGDVINSYSGKTIEIIDTDAEGRLILADGLSYANKKYSPDYLIDLATLTGSVIRALGYEAGGLFTRNTRLAKRIEHAGRKSGDNVWRLPMWRSYKAKIKSSIADVKNLDSLPIGGAIFAATFLESFTNDHPAWAHLDIAGVAYGSNPYSSEKAATGYGVSLLVEFISSLSK